MNGDMNNPEVYNQYMQAYAASQSMGSGAYDASYQDDYMQQEDEWEREGLLDPLWEKQQRKVSKLTNSIHLAKYINVVIFIM